MTVKNGELALLRERLRSTDQRLKGHETFLRLLGPLTNRIPGCLTHVIYRMWAVRIDVSTGSNASSASRQSKLDVWG
jgi:hypothetical protein